MNNTAKKLSLKKTTFANVHGLSNKNNRSTAEDICKLGVELMKDKDIQQNRVNSSMFHTSTT